MRNSIAARISTCFLRRGSTWASTSSSTFRLRIPTAHSKPTFLVPALLATFGKNSIFGPSNAYFTSHAYVRLLHSNPDGTGEFHRDSANDDSNGEVEPIDSWEEEDEAEPEVGDGGDGGGVVVQNCPWGERALSVAKQVLLEFGEGLELYAFKTSPRGYIYVRLDKLSNVYGCPSMDEIELFNRQYKQKLDEIGARGEIPDDLAIEVDVWALGVSAIEMAEGMPPRATVHPMRVLFMISIEPSPMLEDKEKWSLLFHDFVANCLTKDPKFRPSAAEMLKHKFIQKCTSGASILLPKIMKVKQIRAIKALQPRDMASDTTLTRERPGGTMLKEGIVSNVPSRPQERQQSTSSTIPPGGVQTAIEDDFGTVIAHKRDEVGKTVTLQASRMEVLPSTSGQVGSIATHGMYSSPTPTHHGTPTAGFQQKLDTNFEGGPLGAGQETPVTSETVCRKAMDKLWSTYTAGNTVPIPFLRASDISPISLLTNNVLHRNIGTLAIEAMRELFSGETLNPKKGRSNSFRLNEQLPLPHSVWLRLTSSPTLMNLAQTLAYHKVCYEEMPLLEMQAAQEKQTVQMLSETLRTILRL